MKRSQLKNIINKSKEISNNKQEIVGESSFDQFKKSLPIGIDDNYRLEAAWKAYGKPKNFQEAVFYGLIQPIDENNVKLPSIGYDEESDTYEYLNSGRENETIAKDIRVWDNDVIPFVKELKQGGFIRTFNEEKNCWTYSKNKSQETQTEQREVIDSFQKGGKSLNKEEEKSKRNIEQLVTYANNQKPPFIQRILENDERTYTFPDGKIGTHLLNYDTYNGKTYVFPEIQEDPAGNLWWYKDRALDRALERNNVLEMTPEEAEIFVKEYKKYYPNFKPFKEQNGGQLEAFKQGGQMNVIPDGALHAHKNHMELAENGEVTSKGVPVVDNEGNQQAEIEREEWTMSKELTEDVENWYHKFYADDTSEKDKEELAIKCGKRITEELLHNTDDRANLISKLMEEDD